MSDLCMKNECHLCKKPITSKQLYAVQDDKRVHKSCYDRLELYEKDYQTKGIKVPRFPFLTKDDIEEKRQRAAEIELK